ncbi:MAG TPA: PD-(D/E)XK motif protein [Fibrobacteria bacterium]|nr:PD-(D/E)XK motif protein [Fibrobacteria bacterium]
MQTELEEIRTAWSALLPPDGHSGWRSISILSSSTLPIRAARRFPGGARAILFGAHRPAVSPPIQLPTARGFRLEQVEDIPGGDSLAWLAITLVEDAEQGIFEAMALDLLTLLNRTNRNTQSAKSATGLLVERIKAWQEFMDREECELLPASEEIGLFGELEFLRRILHLGLDPGIAIESWKGPFGGNQDFQIGTGAVEVKTSIAGDSFPARISNLDQLDSSQVSPLFLAAFKLKQDIDGESLGDLASSISVQISHLPAIEVRFRLALMKAGYIESHSKSYIRKFKTDRCQLFQVGNSFPSLTRGNVPPEIVHASYTIDLERIGGALDDVLSALNHLGAL